MRKIILVGLCLMLSVFLALYPAAYVFAEPTTKEEQKALQWWTNWVADNGNCLTGESVPGAGDTVDISDIVSKYHLQSAMIKKVGGPVVAKFNADKPPATPASTMKLIIADTALQSKLNLNKTVTVGSDVYYDGDNDLPSSRITLADAMHYMLSSSSNVGANVLMKAMGGVHAFTRKAQSFGYTHTTVNGYYDPSNDGKNTSTISDEVKAMDHIFSNNGPNYKSAKDDLKLAAQNDNVYGVDDIANKWAGTSQVAGNVGLFEISGSRYVIGLYYNGNQSDSQATSAMKNGSADLASAVQGNSAGLSAAAGICCELGGGVTSLVGKDNVEKTVNYFVSVGLTPAQAVGIAANLMWETGGGTTIDPLVAGPDPYEDGLEAWGVAQWTPPTHYTDDKRHIGITGEDRELLTQLEVLWGQIRGKGTVYSTNILPGLQRITNPGDAADYFRENFERCDTSYSSCTTNRVETANELFHEYSGGGVPGAGGGAGCPGEGGAPGTVEAVVAAAKKFSGYRVPYTWGGLHGPGQLDITDPSRLKSIGADCSGSTSWALHQGGMLGSTAKDSTGLESWGQAGKGREMTVWANAGHVFIEFNISGLGHYSFNTAYGQANGLSSGSGAQFFKWGPDTWDTTSGFTPRHWPGT